MNKALVTGANGFIGSALVKELLSNGIEVIALDRKGANGNIPISDMVSFIPFELSTLSDVTSLLAEHKPEVYYHLAWFGTNGALRGDALLQLKNVDWTVKALRQSVEIGCKRFVGAGSITEYETQAAVFSQGNRPGSSYSYGAAKLTAHTLCMVEAQRLGMDIVWAEITNSYGIGENSPRLINSTLRKIIAGEIPEFTSAVQNYDFVYIDDTARALRLIGENGKPFCHYLIGSSNAKPLKEFILEIQRTVAPNKDFIFGNVPFTGVNLSLDKFDCSLTEKDTGFKAEISFEDGIKRTMEWLMQNTE